MALLQKEKYIHQYGIWSFRFFYKGQTINDLGRGAPADDSCFFLANRLISFFYCKVLFDGPSPKKNMSSPPRSLMVDPLQVLIS